MLYQEKDPEAALAELHQEHQGRQFGPWPDYFSACERHGRDIALEQLAAEFAAPKPIISGDIVDIRPLIYLSNEDREKGRKLGVGELYFRRGPRRWGIFEIRETPGLSPNSERQRKVGFLLESYSYQAHQITSTARFIRADGILDIDEAIPAKFRRHCVLTGNDMALVARKPAKRKAEIYDFSFLADARHQTDYYDLRGAMFFDLNSNLWMYWWVIKEGVFQPALLKVWSRNNKYPSEFQESWFDCLGPKLADLLTSKQKDEFESDQEVIIPQAGTIWVLDEEVKKRNLGDTFIIGPLNRPERHDEIRIGLAQVGDKRIKVGILEEYPPKHLEDPRDFPLPPDKEAYCLSKTPGWPHSLLRIHPGIKGLEMGPDMHGQLLYMEEFIGTQNIGHGLYMILPVQEGNKLKYLPVLVWVSAKLEYNLGHAAVGGGYSNLAYALDTPMPLVWETSSSH